MSPGNSLAHELQKMFDGFRHKRVFQPVKQGDEVIIAGSVTDEEAKAAYPRGWKSPRPYIRIVPQPTS
jgi:hypothetical protein